MWRKTLFDYLLALALLPFILPVIMVLILLSTIDTRKFGLFRHRRIGKDGKPFFIYKIRSMKGKVDDDVTLSRTPHITRFGQFIRQNKLDELPQLFNILLNQMSFVGPRPDVPGYADKLEGGDRVILSVKPGITGPAQLAYKNEEALLSRQGNPLQYNDEVIWPDKIRINKLYVQNWSFYRDLSYIFRTIF